MKFTALMPVHNTIKFNLLIKAVNSVLKSKLIPNEFLIVVDGDISNNKKKFLLKIKKYNRCVNIIFKKKRGLVRILNEGLKIAKHDIVARVDADDINHKLRFNKQINLLKKYKIDILGTNTYEIIDNKKYLRKMPIAPNFFNLLMFNPINHMTVMYNRKKILSLGGYPNVKYKEDYALWILASFKHYKFKNIQKPLVYSNIDNNTSSRRKSLSSLLSEFLIFKLFVSKNFLLFPISLMILIFRVFFLLIPNPIYLFVKKRISGY